MAKNGKISNTALVLSTDGFWGDPSDIDEGDRMVYNYPDVTDDGCRQACEHVWRLIEAELLVEWVSERAGRRPRFWWHFSAPEPRRRLGGIGTTEWQKFRSVRPCYEFGLPLLWYFVDSQQPPEYESQSAYLRRHSLLLLGEQERLTTRDFLPEVIRADERDENRRPR